MILSAESTASSFQSSASVEESKRRLLDALSRGLPAAGEILRRRRNVEENTDWEEIQRSRQEEVVQDMRKRLASRPEPTTTPTISSSSGKSPMPRDDTKADSSSSEIGSSPCSSRVAVRLQFLDALEKGFRDLQTPLKNIASNASLTSDGAGVKDNLQSPMEAASEILGPDFFASVNALQERMALRKSSSLASQPQSSPDVTIPLQRRFEVSPSSQENSHCCSRNDAGCDSGHSCERMTTGDTLVVDAELHSAKNSDSGDEGFQSNTEELLRWAEEVLQKASTENEMDARSGIAGAHIPNLPAGCSNSRPRIRGQSERLQRAENWKDEVNRLQQESEEELKRLASEASPRQQHVQDDGWRHRVTSAAEEMRSNISRWRFDIEGQTPQDSRRATSLPRPQRPCAPPSAPSAPSAPRSFRKALYTQNAQLATTEVRWVQLEAELDAGGSRPIHFIDIPWPEGGTSLTDVEPGDDAIVAKRKLAHALRRWHPDKWRRILDRVPESEHSLVMERVKSIAQRLLEEKAKLSEFGGVSR